MSEDEQKQPAGGFLNPYNFVSIPDRAALPEELHDGEPAGHDRYLPDRWTGSIPVTLTTLTPLLLPDHTQAAARSSGGAAPPPLPVRVDHDGRPLLSMSAVKGMLRSAYETITNSRLGVFTGHDGQLAIRSVADTTRLKPAVVIARDEEANTATIRWVNSLTPRRDVRKPRDGKAKAIKPQPAVWVPTHLARANKDGASVEAWLYLAKHPRGFWVWRAVVIGLPGEISSTAPQPPRGQALGKLALSDHPFIRVTGRLHRTDSTFPAGGNRKHDERMVVEQVLTPNHARLELGNEVIGEQLIAGWQAVIDSFEQAHEGEPDLRRKYGSYVHTPKRWRSLPEGRTLHIELDECGKVNALYPAMIGRKPFPGAPKVSLPEAHRPATSREELSPADRVFGWVRHGADEAGVAHRGRLRVEAGETPPEASAVERLPFPLPLTTLNSPKPSQFLFYLADQDGAPLDGEPKQPTAGYPETPGERTLRGRKAYLTHRDVLAGAPASQEYWNLPKGLMAARQPLSGEGPQYREYVAPEGSKDKVTTTVTEWVKPGTEFTVLLRVDNLSRTELSALLWLLDLPDCAALQLGLGKPLGFGAVRVTADWDNVRLFTGDQDQVRAWYTSLSSVPEPEPAPTVQALVGEYDELLREHLARVRAEFLAVATGFPGAPVHYPRTGLVPEVKSYKWWVANDEHGGKRHALPPLVDDDGDPQPPLLPYQAPRARRD